MARADHGRIRVSDAVLYEGGSDGIVVLTLNRPELRNPISDNEMVEAILAALDRLERDVGARVAILTGAGKAFSSGGNINAMKSGGGLNDGLPVRTCPAESSSNWDDIRSPWIPAWPAWRA